MFPGNTGKHFHISPVLPAAGLFYAISAPANVRTLLFGTKKILLLGRPLLPRESSRVVK
jgi:hypothetical protein